MSKIIRIDPPTRKERVQLRLMLIIGTIFLFLFLAEVFQASHKGFGPLYTCLCITLVYMALKYLHEWYHYFCITAPAVKETIQPLTVDILTTFCAGEPYEMLEETLTAMAAIRYPHTSWCCDEADDPVVREMCARLGIRHITRKEKLNAKAGNINHALQYATGDICVVLDPDHIPVPEFLDIVLPYFSDEAIGFVQVVQAYYNHGESLIAKGAAQQTYQFYGPMMMCMNTYGTVQAIGANCTFRRKALDSIGGHAAGLAEDMHTAMQLHGTGWKSVYLPVVITRGLVPDSLGAYYKQQLKWSRGTFELLVTAYPRYFKKFSIFQKVHYLLLPFHYFSGVIVLLNFLIPSLSLILAESPLRMDFSAFLMAAMPVFLMTMLIRQYVQKWVAEEGERGFHVVGGLLQIGTWWVHLTGLVYTFLRKKVPYIPTEKKGGASTSWVVHLPNLLIIGLSIFSIVYGLYRDYTPYSIFMAGIAFLNILILVFVFYASSKHSYSVAGKPVPALKRNFWKVRHWIYSMVRQYALLLMAIVTTGSIVISLSWSLRSPLIADMTLQEDPFFHGLYAPDSDNGLTSVSVINAHKNSAVGIYSFYIALDTSYEKSHLPINAIENVYRQRAIPLLTLEPWMDSVRVFEKMIQGRYDGLLNQVATDLKNLGRPVMIRFAHEPENPRYPWSARGGNKPGEFIRAWHYLHDKMERSGVTNIIWVWNPWKASTAPDYFPGKNYIDYVGVNILNYQGREKGQASISFDSLYRAFHQMDAVHSGLPVLITEAGTLSYDKANWWKQAWKAIKSNYPEIRGLIAFNDTFDHYDQDGYQASPLDWSFPAEKVFNGAPDGETAMMPDTAMPRLQPTLPINHRLLPVGMKAVKYDKGYHWFRNIHTASVRTIEKDIKDMQALGVNTLFRTVGGVYDHNVLKEISAHNLQTVGMLWPDLTLASLKNTDQSAKEKKRLLNLVKEYAGHPSLMAWNLSNDFLETIEQVQPLSSRLVYASLYIKWLQDLITELRAIDPRHPITATLYSKGDRAYRYALMKRYCSTIDQFLVGISASDSMGFNGNIPEWLPLSDKEDLLPGRIKEARYFPIVSWQDQHAAGSIQLDGIIDNKGRRKAAFYGLMKQWERQQSIEIHEFKVLKPAKITFENATLQYRLLVKDRLGQWILYNEGKPSLKIEWFLIQRDAYGNAIAMEEKGSGALLKLTIPAHPERYRIFVEVIQDNIVYTTESELNIPLNDSVDQ